MMLNESEKKGVGSLVSLQGLARGETLKITVNNEIPGVNVKKNK